MPVTFDWNHCPDCGAELDTGYECNGCEADWSIFINCVSASQSPQPPVGEVDDIVRELAPVIAFLSVPSRYEMRAAVTRAIAALTRQPAGAIEIAAIELRHVASTLRHADLEHSAKAVERAIAALTRQQGEWIAWKPGDALPADGMYWCAFTPSYGNWNGETPTAAFRPASFFSAGCLRLLLHPTSTTVHRRGQTADARGRPRCSAPRRRRIEIRRGPASAERRAVLLSRQRGRPILRRCAALAGASGSSRIRASTRHRRGQGGIDGR